MLAGNSTNSRSQLTENFILSSCRHPERSEGPRERGLTLKRPFDVA
jgi:hypothetical protein